MTETRWDNRKELLTEFASRTVGNLPKISGKQPVQLLPGDNGSTIRAICGPRSGSIELNAGLDNDRILKALTDGIMGQLLPWDSPKPPVAYLAGRYIRLEAGWPWALQETDIPLSALSLYPKNRDLFVAGKNESGVTVRLAIGDQTPHFLFAGQTGSGKSVGMVSATAQLSQSPDNRFVLIDGKCSKGLKGLSPLDGLPGQVGPFARNPSDAINAIGWAYSEMMRRYESEEYNGRIIIVIDEVQELSSDPLFSELMRRIGAKGREAGVHLVIGTQYPVKALMGDASIKQHMVGRVVFAVKDQYASMAAIGDSEPRADRVLLGRGDAFVITDAGTHRVQGCYIPMDELENWKRMRPGDSRPQPMDEWPEYRAEDVGQEPPTKGRQITGMEAGISMYAAKLGMGLTRFTELFKQTTGEQLGTGVGRKFLSFGQECLDQYSRMSEK